MSVGWTDGERIGILFTSHRIFSFNHCHYTLSMFSFCPFSEKLFLSTTSFWIPLPCHSGSQSYQPSHLHNSCRPQILSSYHSHNLDIRNLFFVKIIMFHVFHLRWKIERRYFQRETYPNKLFLDVIWIITIHIE